MSTNHAERLDDALIRAGRVDMKLELGLTNRDTNSRLFRAIFMSDNTSSDGKPAEDEAMLAKFAVEFANKVPEREFSPADIQSFLLKYRQSPHMAVENVGEWIVRVRQEKSHISRADPSVSEEGFRSDIRTTLPDKSNSPSAITQDGVQAREMADTTGTVETPLGLPDSHCCSCQILQDVKGILAREVLAREETSSVQPP